MSDPRLKAAMEEIKDVLKRHDVTGVIILASPTHAEHFTQFDASWSCAHYDGEMVRFQAERDMFPSVEAQKECIETTVGFIAGFSDVCRNVNERLNEILEHLSTKFQIFHRTRRE